MYRIIKPFVVVVMCTSFIFSSAGCRTGSFPPIAFTIDNPVALEDSGELIFHVHLALGPDTSATVNYAVNTLSSTATAGDDYVPMSGTLEFGALETDKTISITLLSDSTFENDETVKIVLSNAVGAKIETAEATGTIKNDDAAEGGPSLSVNDVLVDENNGPAVFTVTLSNPSDSLITVNYGALNGTATLADNDFATASNTLTFSPGQTTKMVTVTINDDQVVEPNETFTVDLTDPSGATISDSQGVGTIINDDVAQLSINDVQVSESAGSIFFMVTTSLLSSSDITVHYALGAVGDSATLSQDYSDIIGTGTLTIGAKSMSNIIPLHIINENTLESDETFTVTLSSPVGAELDDAIGIGTIVNDDEGPLRVSINDPSTTEKYGQLTFTVTLSRDNGSQLVQVSFATANGTATVADSDYSSASGTLLFQSNQTSKTVTINIKDDWKQEGDETLVINLSNPQGAELGDAQGIGTIINNDIANPVLATTQSHSCAVGPDHTLWCWGSNANRQLGTTAVTESLRPRQVGTENDWDFVTVGSSSATAGHTCALKVDGRLYCWGINADGQLGVGSTSTKASPTLVGAVNSNWIAISTFTKHTCGIKEDTTTPSLHTLWCWGDDGSGQLGNGSPTTDVTSPTQVVTGFTDWAQVSAGAAFTCARRSNSSGTIYCWGLNSSGQLGTNSHTNLNQPGTAVTSSSSNPWTSVFSGGRHVCALRTNSLYCWGQNTAGQTGISGSDVLTPNLAMAVGVFPLGVGLGMSHTCAINSTGILQCWGDNDDGELGRNSTSDSSGIPTNVQISGSTVMDWISVAAGGYYSGNADHGNSCAARSTGKVYCWGDNPNGQIGNGTKTDASSPQALTLPPAP